MNTMLCGLEDDRVRFEPDDEEDETLTPLEQRLEWICDEWKCARESDSYEEWHNIQMMLYGASASFIHCIDRHDDKRAIDVLSRLAFEFAVDAVNRGKYEGAK